MEATMSSNTNVLVPAVKQAAEAVIAIAQGQNPTDQEKLRGNLSFAVIGFVEELVETLAAKHGSLKLRDIVDELSTYANVCEVPAEEGASKW